MRGLLVIIGVAIVLAFAVTPVFVGDQLAYAEEGGGKAAHTGPLYTNPGFWFAALVVGVVGLVGAKKANMLDNTAVAVVVSLLIALSYFLLVDHYLMDMQGLDYWYLFRG